jgi:hypothetical protein
MWSIYNITICYFILIMLTIRFGHTILKLSIPLCFITMVFQKKVSRNRGRSWNVLTVDTGARLYYFFFTWMTTCFVHLTIIRPHLQILEYGDMQCKQCSCNMGWDRIPYSKFRKDDGKSTEESVKHNSNITSNTILGVATCFGL